jgi:asparagine synthase (glutamine-hydrolysing)
MCGMTGIVHFGALEEAPAIVHQMTDTIVHRGPDGEGFWHDKYCALGFRRLAIVDIEGGHQPMANEDGSVRVVFNGEIYNHRELRRELIAKGHRFQSTHSDTEVLVHGWEEWGVDLPRRLNGMFAFAVWDQRHQQLFLARDRYGIKPLYLARLPSGGVLFASEIRAIHVSGLITKKQNLTSVLEYFSHQNLWGPDTLFAGVEQFPAGTWEKIKSNKSQRHQYWDFTFERDSQMSLSDAAEAHRAILERAVARQIAADVPVMSYLSGGIDSTALATAAYKTDPTVRSYSCVFDLSLVGDDKIVDEREFSRLAASYLTISHVEMELMPTVMESALLPTIDALEDLRMGMAYVNYLIASRVAKDGKVVLSGTGGDEVHGGYIYRYQATAVKPLAHLLSYKGVLARLSGRHRFDSKAAINKFHQLVNYLVPDTKRKEVFTPEFLSLAGEYSAEDALNTILNACPSDHVWDKVLYTDAKTYLHGLLIMEDKLSMANSLETRVPLLDNELVDFVNRLPWRHLFDGQIGKIVFRESVRPWVPDVIYRKPKMGFGPPDASWYRTSLKQYIEKILSPTVIEKRGIFLPAFVAKVLAEHFNAQANHLPIIWSLLSFETWCGIHKF